MKIAHRAIIDLMIRRKQRICIIGAGVVGCAVAYILSKNKNFEIIVLEKNNKIPDLNQSSRNAGVIHAGIYYSKHEEPMKAKFCVEGNRLLYEFCEKEGVPHKKTGKLIIATNEAEKEYLDYFYESAIANNVPGIKKISKNEIIKLEPNISAIYALYLPTSGIVDVDKLILKFKNISKNNGARFITKVKVIDIKTDKAGFTIKTVSNKKMHFYNADIIINSAGLYSDVIAKMINKKSQFEIVPTRGEFAQFENVSNLKINMNIYPTPYGFYNSTGEKAQVGLEDFLRLHKAGTVTRTVGVHITPTITAKSSLGKIAIIGPVKTVNITKTDYTEKLKTTEVFLRKVTHFHPALKQTHLNLRYTGLMASEKINKDFIIQRDSNFPFFINLIGIDSPGMTACLSITNHVKKLVRETITA